VLGAIISRVLAGSGCPRFLAGDGITVPDLSIRALPGIVGATWIDVRLAKKDMPAIGQAASIAKNLDEYQYRICSLVPSLPDSDRNKLGLQKYRIASVAAFAALAAILKDPSQSVLAQWNVHAGPLMEAASDAYIRARSNSKVQIANNQAFEFFSVPEDKIDAALAAFYGIE
jgi:hypothetical protein